MVSRLEKSVTSIVPNIFAIERILKTEPGNVNTRFASGETPLTFAVTRGNQAVVGLLLKYGANPNINSNFDIPPLQIAVFRNSINIVNLLLTYGANVNAADEFGNTALTIALQNNNEELVKLLLDNNAEFTRETEEILKQRYQWYRDSVELRKQLAIVLKQIFYKDGDYLLPLEIRDKILSYTPYYMMPKF